MTSSGLEPLCSPVNISICLSPAYFSCISYVWEQLTKESYFPAIKKAGMKHDSTLSMGFKLKISKCAFSYMLDLTNLRAIEVRKEGILVFEDTISLASCFSLQNGESKTIPAIDGSLWPCKRAEAAPIDRPHRPIKETFPDFLKCSTTQLRSSLSYHPNEIYSPSDWPAPEKSKQKT
jgi:hypothetical protein